MALSADDDLTVLAVTDQFIANCNRRREDLVGSKFLDAFTHDPEDPGTAAIPHLRDSLEQVVRERAPHTLPIQRYDVPGPDGRVQTRYWTIDNRPVFGADGEVAYIMNRAEDVTELLRFKEADARLSAADKNLRDHAFDDMRSHVKKDGTTFFSSGSIEGLRDEDGRLRGYVKVIRDVTEHRWLEEEQARLLESERRARAEAERASSLKDDFLATVSHELRTPLNAILGWSQIIARHPRHDPKSLEQGINVIQRNARAQAQLIDDLLDMSRIISGKVQLHAQHVGLVNVVDAALAAARPSAEAKGILLVSSLDGSEGLVWADPERLQQIFWNLLTNALKFTPRGGRIEVSVERSSSRLNVRVTDTGKGIAPTFIPFVFDRFRQADATTTLAHGGLGIGLSIVKNLVELHGGTVDVSSPGEGQGATFTVSLPLPTRSSERAADERRPATGEQPGTLTGLDERLDRVTVLVVDDEADARELVGCLLTGCGATVLSAGPVGEALVIMREARVDVILSDIGMPHEDGYALIRKVRALPAAEGGRAPAAALTAFARTEDRQRALRAGFQIHVTKPIEPAELVTVVKRLASSSPRPS